MTDRLILILFSSALISLILIIHNLMSHFSAPLALSRIKEDVAAEFHSLEGQSLKNRTKNSNLEDLTPITHGNPIINILLTDFRSGSTFTGEILNAFPASYYHYEPLLHYGGLTRIQNNEQGQRAVKEILQMLHCNFHGLDRYINSANDEKYPLSYNARVFSRFNCVFNKYSTDLLSSACRLFPVQTMKITRLMLKFGRQLLEDESLNMRLVFLIRDPRGVMKSRYNFLW